MARAAAAGNELIHTSLIESDRAVSCRPKPTHGAVFLFEIDVPWYMGLLFKESNPNKGLNDPAPPFDPIAPLIKQWYSLGTLKVDESGRGTLVYDKGDDLYATVRPLD